MTTYQELIAQKAELDRLQADLEKQIAETLRNERASVISQIKTLMAENGITAADLASGKPGRPPKIGIANPARPARSLPNTATRTLANPGRAAA